MEKCYDKFEIFDKSFLIDDKYKLSIEPVPKEMYDSSESQIILRSDVLRLDANYCISMYNLTLNNKNKEVEARTMFNTLKV